MVDNWISNWTRISFKVRGNRAERQRCSVTDSSSSNGRGSFARNSSWFRYDGEKTIIMCSAVMCVEQFSECWPAEQPQIGLGLD